MVQEFRCRGTDNNEFVVHAWEAERPRAFVVIAHGAAEHGLRYARFAGALVAQGFSIFAPDHRGHGKTAGVLSKAGNAGPDGFNGMIRDLRSLIEELRGRHPGFLIFLLGHSMGAALAQRFIQLHSEMLAGVVLSGSPGIRPNLEVAAKVTSEAALGSAAELPSELFKQSFASFNQGFEPVITGYEWLSRDASEVRRYVEDPWCGFPFTNGLVAEMSACAVHAASPENLARIRSDLPILLFSGTHDRVGGNGEFVKRLAIAYKDAGIRDLELNLYSEGRHEMLNETNRETVESDVVDWLLRHTP